MTKNFRILKILACFKNHDCSLIIVVLMVFFLQWWLMTIQDHYKMTTRMINHDYYNDYTRSLQDDYKDD